VELNRQARHPASAEITLQRRTKAVPRARTVASELALPRLLSVEPEVAELLPRAVVAVAAHLLTRVKLEVAQEALEECAMEEIVAPRQVHLVVQTPRFARRQSETRHTARAVEVPAAAMEAHLLLQPGDLVGWVAVAAVAAPRAAAELRLDPAE
jgi:hypothetical protein